MKLDTENGHSKKIITKLNRVLEYIDNNDEILDRILRWMDDGELNHLTNHLIERYDIQLDVVKNVNLKLNLNITELKDQKSMLLKMPMDSNVKGMIHLIDGIQDYIVATKQATEQEVFTSN